ncbi:hypothetical protein [Pseudophaeobacter sp.]|uniref:hypothetical protein n=1 Tax=Pseudophaeobacter sp. TaxID=1971739 RepID=UPI003296D8F6
MAFSVTVLKDLNLVVTQYSGVVDAAQMMAAQRATLEDADYQPGMVELTVVSELQETDMDFPQVLSHRARMAEYYGGKQEPTAHYIIAATDLGYGLARMYQTLVEEHIPNLHLSIYRSEGEALQAMGRAEANLAELLGG